LPILLVMIKVNTMNEILRITTFLGAFERRPRLYGLFGLVAAFGLGYWARCTAAQGSAFALLMLSAYSGAAGILYLALGREACRRDSIFAAWVNPNKLTWKSTLFIIGPGVGFLLLSGLLYWLIKL
jgi:hypothetical protein